MDTSRDSFKESITLALQRVFYQLETHGSSVSTAKLTKAFGWTSAEAFIQHDVQELARLLFDQLEQEDEQKNYSGNSAESMKASIASLFEGSITTKIRCRRIKYQSSKTEIFSDLQLDVRGCPNVYRSFDKYTESEPLVGENRYRAGDHGLQDADRYTLFSSFPPILILHLKRFHYDSFTNSLSKVNDQYMFYSEINLDRYLDREEEEADEGARRKKKHQGKMDYVLASVLVHSGSNSGGHYYAYIRTSYRKGGGSTWHKFDDTRVTAAAESEAIAGNFGGYGRVASAYMLAYVRKRDAENILDGGASIPTHLLDYFTREKAGNQGYCLIS